MFERTEYNVHVPMPKETTATSQVTFVPNAFFDEWQPRLSPPRGAC